MKAILALENGTLYKGEAFGAPGEAYGEVVFNTSMTGYQEILTDPSYKGQIVAMTYPLIGNYGTNREDVESRRPFVEGFVVKEYCKAASNWRSEQSLGDYLKAQRIVGIEGVDTRSLTLHIRESGAMKAVISTTETDGKRLVQKVKASPGMLGRDLVKEVTCDKVYRWSTKGDYRVVVLDCGIKFNTLRLLSARGCAVTVVPAGTTAPQIMAMRPHGVLLSNGPGDPSAVPYVVETVRQLIGTGAPLFGICLGQQMISQALGGKTFKLKFGHHGGNHPVKDLKTGKVMITVQNHGFCVDSDSLPKREIEVTHMNLNDRTLEGIRHKKLPVFALQFHPESSPGPHDAEYMFDQFVKLMGRNATRSRTGKS